MTQWRVQLLGLRSILICFEILKGNLFNWRLQVAKKKSCKFEGVLVLPCCIYMA
ncbi:hypothetical protein Sjap_004812 [Stephania japonica]|uniref:Uncharacterized protein n=1 Tax=Stephania japonica TaxID=461633 RepID=A0AAP0PJF8_9MAGN